ncbi:MAG: hypothetical protein ACOC0U_00010 [Desulfovibrionales bacterium]
MFKILVDHRLCVGCRLCQIACSMQHYPGRINPKRGRIHVFKHRSSNAPLISGPKTKAGCLVHTAVKIGDSIYDGCALCRASCPEKGGIFSKEEEALLCDLCGSQDEYMPSCVRACPENALRVIEVPSRHEGYIQELN